MTHYKDPLHKASEAVTFRLTLEERRLLDYLSELEDKSLTDLIRELLLRRADEWGIDEVPPRAPKKRPGRPRKKVPDPVASPEVAATASFSGTEEERQEKEGAVEGTTGPREIEDSRKEAQAQETATIPNASAPTASGVEDDELQTLRDIVKRFRKQFATRAEGTRRELEEALQFLTSPQADGGLPLLPSDLPLTALTSERLAVLREAMRTTRLRMARKNLYLTYLRMMLHFAVKQPEIALGVNPALELKPFTLKELEGGLAEIVYDL